MTNYEIDDSRKGKYSSEDFSLDYKSLESYARGCIKSLEILDYERPDILLCPLRGAYPPTRVLSSFIPNLEKSPKIITFPGSEFLPDKETLFYSAIENILSSYDKGPHIATVDTAITGSSARRFKRMVKHYLPKVYKKQKKDKDYTLEYTMIKLWHKREDFKTHRHSHKVRTENLNFDFNDYNIGVKELFAEDIPELLGIDYPIQLGGGKKSSFISRVNTKNTINLLFEGGTKAFLYPQGKQNTADLFIQLVTNQIEEILEDEFKGKYSRPHPPLCEY